MASVTTAAGTIVRPTIADIDRMLGSVYARAKFAPGDVDRLLDARLVLMAERDFAAEPAGAV